MAEEWNTETLKAHFEAMLVERDKRYDERRANQQREVEVALVAINERLSQLNELRGQSADRDKNMITRVEYDTAHDALVGRVQTCESRLDRQEGRGSGLNAGWGYLVAGISLLVAIISVILVVVAL
jgi:hypothetical protein